MNVGANNYPELSSTATWHTDLSPARSLGLDALRRAEFALNCLSLEDCAWKTDRARGFLDVAGKGRHIILTGAFDRASLGTQSKKLTP